MTSRVYCSLSVVLLCLSACLSTNHAGVVAKQGQCPSTKSGGGNCAELCSYDRDCPNNEKCCSNGCGRQCMAPYTVKSAAEPAKPAVCAENCQKAHPDAQCFGPKGGPPEPVVMPAAEPVKPAVCAENCQKTHPNAQCSGPKRGPPEPVVMPAAEPAKPPVKHVAEPAKPPVKPVAEPAKPPVKPVAEPAKPPVKPVAEPAKPPVKPVAKPEKPAVCAENCKKTHPDAQCPGFKGGPPGHKESGHACS
ncbi:transcriptional regulatory protein AlgP-like [Rhinichthys klamathensis goyatoka]|uniref:transcriptional regulatory protein AlgP-like n=1 Tax=Rhinichthys klamathensis goyatoka TaxID=3034132 RepID=UPI0024B5F2A6|nr:transcriptional regulatory protein AlgP-like [Rhinichthys klamathensis goyatoka]